MAAPLLRTKLHIPPVRSKLVLRPRLIEQLDAGRDRRLTLISAPAGFGKTTLLSQWIQQSEFPVAWLSLDKGDNDPARFWAYVIAALQLVRAEIGKAALTAFQPPQLPPTEEFLMALIDEVAVIPEPFTLILDDYHVIETQPIHNTLASLLAHLPPKMHLVIASRADLPLPIARLRGHGQLTELRLTDLCFTPHEVTEFLNQVVGLKLSADEIATLSSCLLYTSPSPRDRS